MTPLQKILNFPVLRETPQKRGLSTTQENCSFDGELAGHTAASSSAETIRQKIDTTCPGLQSISDIEHFPPWTLPAAGESETPPFPESEDLFAPSDTMPKKNRPLNSDSRSSERIVTAAEQPEYPAAHPQVALRSGKEADVATADTTRKVENVVAAANAPAPSTLKKTADPVVRQTPPAELLVRAMQQHPKPYLRRPTPAANPLMPSEMSENREKVQKVTVPKGENYASPVQPIGNPIKEFVVIEQQVNHFSPLGNIRVYASTAAAQYRRVQENV